MDVPALLWQFDTHRFICRLSSLSLRIQAGEIGRIHCEGIGVGLFCHTHMAYRFTPGMCHQTDIVPVFYMDNVTQQVNML